MANQLIELTNKGLYCRKADLYIDPSRGVPKAVITHAHSDHARPGSGLYIAHEHTLPLLDLRLGRSINKMGLKYSEKMVVNGVSISLHPAGHIPGSAQVRIEYRGEIWVVSGDYKVEVDGLCIPFEPVKCHTFITESTFGLPIFNWRPQSEIFDDINSWWKKNKEKGIHSIILAYSLGKAQRILMNLDLSIGEVYTHPIVNQMNETVKSFFPSLPSSKILEEKSNGEKLIGSLIITPTIGSGTSIGPYSVAMASGWMHLPDAGRRGNADKGFVLSDHADWKGLNSAIIATEAERVYVTHGFTTSFSRWLNERGIEAHELKTLYKSEGDNMNVEALI